MYHPQKSPPNKILWGIMLGILGIHLVALVVFGGWTVYQAVKPKDPTFDEPPPVEKIERVQFRVPVMDQQKKSVRPKQKLQVKQISDIRMPEMNVQVPNLNGNANIGRFGGENFGNISDSDGLVIEGVTVELFDIEAKGEKFLFMVDVRSDLLQDKKGGIPTYTVIKEDITRLVNDLSSGVLFNMILFDGPRMEIWRPNLVPATSSNKKDFEQWLAPVNTGLKNTGIRANNYRPKGYDQPFTERLLTRGWTSNRIFYALLGGLEQSADAIYLLTDEVPALDQVRESYKFEEDELERRQEKYLDQIEDLTDFDTVEEYKEGRKESEARVRDAVRAYKEKENQNRVSKGLPPRVYTSGENWRLKMDMEKVVEDEFDDYVPYIHPPDDTADPLIPEREVTGWIEQNLRLIYDQAADDRPQLNVIVFRGEDEEFSKEKEDAVDEFVDVFDGEYRVLKGLGKIDSGAAAK